MAVTRAIQDEVDSQRAYHFVTPMVEDSEKPHCNNCGDVARGTYFCVGHFVLCGCCMNEAEEASSSTH